MAKYADAKQFVRGAAFVEQKYVYELTDDIGMEDILRPDFWRPISDKLKRLGIVTCIGGKDNIDVDLRCYGVGQGYCMMKVVRMSPSDSEFEDEVIESERRVEYRPGFQWCVVGVDNGILQSGFDTREDAEEFLTNMDA